MRGRFGERPRRGWAAAALLGVTLAAGFAEGRTTADRAAQPQACVADAGEPATVRAVAEDFSLALDDGRLVRLAGIDPVAATADRPAMAAGARARLAAWLDGQTVVLQALSATADRWGRLPALIFADPEQGGDGEGLSTSVAVFMVRQGLARGRPEPAVHGCWEALLAAETAARAAALGLWADPHYAVREADDLPGLAALAGTLAIVEGRLAHVGRGRTSIYLDLGPPHRALALRLGRRTAFIADQLALGQNGGMGQRMRVRGVVDDRSGPMIDIDDADQIERIEDVVQGSALGGAAP